MYHQHGDSRFPAEFGTGHSHAGLDSSGAAGRYMYGPYYGSKGPDGSPFGSINPPGSGMHAFGGKPPAVALQDSAYPSRWSTPGYMRAAGLKPGSDYMYTNQPASGGTYPDMGPMMNMSGYLPPSYGPSAPYTSQYPFTARGFSGGGAAPGFMDGYSDAGQGSSGHPSWSNKPLSVGKGQEVSSGQSPQWSYRTADGYSSSTPNTPGRPATTATDSSQMDPASQSVDQQPTLLPQQQAMSPHAHFDNELKKQPSVSSLRDALLSTPSSASQQQYAPYSPRVPGGHPSPMTPSTNFPHTPDASTPAGGSSIMSPHMQQQYDDKNDGQLPSESELINSFAPPSTDEEGRPIRVSPFQVESILGIRNDKPIELEANLGNVNSVSSQEGNSVLSPQERAQDSSQPCCDNNVHAIGETNSKQKPDQLPGVHPLKVDSFPDPHAEDGSVVQDLPSPLMSPVDHNHPSITSQYQFSDDQRRKEFLDLLFAFLNLEGVGLVRIPTVSKAPLDLFMAFSSVQNLGGFVNVTQKKLWPEVMKLLSASSTDNRAGSMRTLMRFYVKLLLPYECHIRHTTVADCLSKVDSSVFKHMSIPKKVNLRDEEGGLESINTFVQGGKINGEAIPRSTHKSRRLNSQTSESSTGETNSHELCPMNDEDKEQTSDVLPEETQTTPVDSYPQDMSSDEPLPEISAQETESLLAMPASPFASSQPPVTTGDPSTPSADQATPPSSFPPPYAPQGSQEWGPSSGQEIFPGSGYPSSYSVDPSPYQPPSQVPPMPPGYSPYNPPSQHDVLMDYHLDMSSPMMRSPYDANLYHMGIPPAMHGLPGSRPNPYFYRPHMMSRPDPFGVRSNDVMYPGAHGMNSDWAWQQGSRFPTMMHHHSIQSPNSTVHQLPTSRVHMVQHVSHPAAQHPSSTNQSPGPAGDTTKQQWQDQAKSVHSRVLDKTSAQSRGTKGECSTKTGASKSEHAHMFDSLKRPLPDWSGCVEGTKPQLAKRKHLISVDCGNVEPWRVMMSLKSGLLSESTWALDTLNILLHDDSTVGYFHLKHHHSLLNTLVDHLSKVLRAVFPNEFNSLPNHPNHGCNVTDALSISANERLQSIDASNKEGGASIGGDIAVALPTESVSYSSVDDNELRDADEGHRLSHIEIPTADESLLFTVNDQIHQIRPYLTGSAAEGSQRIQRIDETPVSELLHREGLKNQLPLHYFGRSPRRREHSILEDIQIREELEKEIDERLHSETDSEDKQRAGHDQKHKEVFTSPAKTSREKEVSVLKEESEIYQKESLPLWSLAPNREILQGRCLCLSNILRSLSFIPGNDVEFSQHPGVLTILGHILMLHHRHLMRQNRHNAQSNESDVLLSTTTRTINQLSLPGVDVWWWDCLDILRENTLVILSNISGQLDLSIFPECVSCPVITGLLHWVTCPSARAVDPLPDTAMALALSPQRLVLEALAKISISEINVDFILATPPVTRLDTLFMHLVQFIGQKKHPVMRQFALVLLSNLAQGNEAASRLLAQQKMVVPLLVECIESSEQTSCNSRGQLVGGYNPEDPNSLSVAMLRRAATTLHCLAKVPLNRTAFLPYRDRTLYLATSQYVEPSVSSILMDMVFELGKL